MKDSKNVNNSSESMNRQSQIGVSGEEMRNKKMKEEMARFRE